MEVFQTIIRLLTFRLTKEEMLDFNKSHLMAGLIGTWVVGMGRYWDDPGAKLLQHLGVGSVIYVFVLAVFIWIIVKPYKVEDWTYFRVLTFICLTSFPAVFYAFPIERWVDIHTANIVNVWFLAVVAAWRMILLLVFIYKFTELGAFNTFVITFLPICLIITTLTVLNLHRVVFDIMGGVRNATPHDGAYSILVGLTLVSALLVGPLLLGYIFGIYFRRKKLHARRFN